MTIGRRWAADVAVAALGVWAQAEEGEVVVVAGIVAPALGSVEGETAASAAAVAAVGDLVVATEAGRWRAPPERVLASRLIEREQTHLHARARSTEPQVMPAEPATKHAPRQ